MKEEIGLYRFNTGKISGIGIREIQQGFIKIQVIIIFGRFKNRIGAVIIFLKFKKIIIFFFKVFHIKPGVISLIKSINNKIGGIKQGTISPELVRNKQVAGIIIIIVIIQITHYYLFNIGNGGQ
jgi:hypothetical protein